MHKGLAILSAVALGLTAFAAILIITAPPDNVPVNAEFCYLCGISGQVLLAGLVLLVEVLVALAAAVTALVIAARGRDWIALVILLLGVLVAVAGSVRNPVSPPNPVIAASTVLSGFVAVPLVTLAFAALATRRMPQRITMGAIVLVAVVLKGVALLS